MKTNISEIMANTAPFDADDYDHIFPDDPIAEPGSPSDIRADEVLPPVLANMARSLAISTQTPECLSIMMILSVVAIAVQDKVEIIQSRDYREPLNLWTMTVLPPGSRKSAVVKRLTDVLTKWEKDQLVKFGPRLADNNARRKSIIEQLKTVQAKMGKAKDRTTLEALEAEHRDLELALPAELKAPQLSSGDITTEALQGKLVDHNGAFGLISAEGGSIETIAGIYTNGACNPDVFLQAHAGESIRVDRKGREAHIDRATLTIGLAVQPEIVRGLGRKNKTKLIGTGFFARFLCTVPPSNIGTRSARHDKPVPSNFEAAYETSILHLLAAAGSNGTNDLKQLTLSDEAGEMWLNFWEFIERLQGAGGELEMIQDWSAKLPGAVLRVAGICHLAEYGLRPALDSQRRHHAQSYRLSHRFNRAS
ncbi:MAG: DUF3987 domain-containing protein [Candidatus Obscuribacter sp.]|nr:DUF3987 domain-containing protein [Candidatus Obscuribacter sp.]